MNKRGGHFREESFVTYVVILLIFIGIFGVFSYFDKASLTGFAIGGGGDQAGSYWNLYDNGDGSGSLKIYTASVNYDSGSGYAVINSGFSASGDPLFDYENTGQYYDIYFKQDPTTGQVVKYTKDSIEVTFQPMALNYRNSLDMIDQINMIQSVVGSPSGNEFSYLAAYGIGIDLNFYFLPEVLKEKLVVNSFSDLPLPASFITDQPGVTLDLDFIFGTNSNHIVIEGVDWDKSSDITTSEEIYIQDDALNTLYYFPKPYAYDSNGTSQSGYYFLKKQGPNLYINLKIPYTWINDSARVYPIYIDPSIQVSTNGTGGGDSYVGSGGDANKNFGSALLLRTGFVARTYIQFNISEIPEGQEIDSSQVCMYVKTEKVQSINVSHVYVSWDESAINWNNQPCGANFDSSANCNLTPESFVNVDGSSQNTWKCWNVKNTVQEAYNVGEFVSMVFYTSDSDVNTFNSKEHTDFALWPYLNVSYSLSDAIAPDLSIAFPIQSGIISPGDLILDHSASDPNLQSCWYSLDSGSNLSLTCNTNESFSASSGSHTIYVYANDTLGNENYSSVSFDINSNPSITLVNPQNTLYLTNESLALDFIYSDVDSDIDSCWYSANSLTNVTLPGCANITFGVPSEGSYTFEIFINDSYGVESSDSVSFNVDLTGISLSITEPTGTKSSRTGIPLTYTATGNNLECWYNIKTSVGGDVFGNTTLVNCNDTTFDVSADGDYVLNLFANNTLGNSNLNSSSFSVDTGVATPPSGGDSGGGGGGSSGGIISGVTRLEMGILSSLVAGSGDSKKISWNAENTGTKFLNDCEFKSSGDFSSWVFSNEGLKNLAAGESYDFLFDLTIPEDSGAGFFTIGVSLLCREINQSSEFIVEVIEKEIGFELLGVERNQANQVKIIYSLEELSGIQQDMELQFLLFDDNNEKVAELKQQEILAANSKGEFESFIPVDPSLEGELSLLINLNSATYSGFVQENIILGLPVTGLPILGDAGTIDNVATGVIVVLFVLFAFFVIKRIFSHKKKIPKKRKSRKVGKKHKKK